MGFHGKQWRKANFSQFFCKALSIREAGQSEEKEQIKNISVDWCGKVWVRRPVSRVLCHSFQYGKNAATIPLRRTLLCAWRDLPGWRCKASVRKTASIPIRSCSRWGLPCPLPYGRGGALLPHRFTLTGECRRSVLCGAFPGVTPAGRYPAPCLSGARTFLPCALSSLARAAAQPPDRCLCRRFGRWRQGFGISAATAAIKRAVSSSTRPVTSSGRKRR